MPLRKRGAWNRAETEITHSPMVCAEQAGLLVLVTDRTEVSRDDLVVGVLPHIVDRHLEHAEVKKCDRAEGPARYEDEGLLVRIPERPPEPVSREPVAW